jgi:DNA/RNA-binding protein KIN17
MKIFSDNAGGILDQYSKDFEKYYLTMLRMRHGTKQVNANNVYQEVIQDKQHIHMNATHWTTLTDFVQYLGRTGKCVVEENERGWFVSYIERDAGIIERQEAQQRREAADRKAEARQAQQMRLQREEAAKALDRAGHAVTLEATEIRDLNDHQPIKVDLSASLSVNPSNKLKMMKTGMLAASNGIFGDDDDDEEDDKHPINTPKLPTILLPGEAPPPLSIDGGNKQHTKKRKDEISASKNDDPTQKRSKKSHNMENQNEGDGTDKQDQQKEDNWLYRDIVVRVIAKDLAGGKYFRRKAVVDKLVDKYTAEVEILDSDPDARDGGDILRLDQADLETVIPKLKHKDSSEDTRKRKEPKVRVLVGKYRGRKATIEHLDKKKYVADLLVRLEDGETKLVGDVPYEHFSQIA